MRRNPGKLQKLVKKRGKIHSKKLKKIAHTRPAVFYRKPGVDQKKKKKSHIKVQKLWVGKPFLVPNTILGGILKHVEIHQNFVNFQNIFGCKQFLLAIKIIVHIKICLIYYYI